MTDQIDAAIRLRPGREDRAATLAWLLGRYRLFCRGAFHVPNECLENSNSLMLTGCGGLIAAITHGWWNYRGPEDDPKRIPRLEVGEATAAPRAAPAEGTSRTKQ